MPSPSRYRPLIGGQELVNCESERQDHDGPSGLVASSTADLVRTVNEKVGTEPNSPATAN